MSMFEAEGRDKWMAERLGKFTASLIGRLMISGKKPGELFSAGAWNYIRQVAIEKITFLFERPELDEVKSLLHGKVHEEPAFDLYKKVTRNNSMRYFGSMEPLFLNYNEDSGGSPDGIMGVGETIEWTLELKCPRNPSVHFDYLQMNSQFDLKEYSVDYYSQVQFTLMLTKANGGHFVSYDDRYRNPAHRIKVIEVLPDQKFQNDLEMRLQKAIKERNKIIESLG